MKKKGKGKVRLGLGRFREKSMQVLGLVLLFILLAGDVEMNPGPAGKNFYIDRYFSLLVYYCDFTPGRAEINVVKTRQCGEGEPHKFHDHISL